MASGGETLGDDSQFSASDQAVYAGLTDGEGVIVDTKTAFYFGLNKTAAFLWEQLQGRTATVAELAEALCARFAVDRSTAERDVRDFLSHVVESGLARRQDRAPHP